MKFNTSKKLFAHIDCDSFFAECEIFRNPKIKNDFVLVGEEIILACNYKTKAFGIKTGTPIWKAKEILKGKGVYLRGDHDFYSLISSKLMTYLYENTINVEPFSIDEAFCEITGFPELYNMSLEDYILKLQKDIIKYVGVPVSIGVSTTRIKAKIFSKINKPRGIFIDTGNSKEFYKNLPISIVPFIGKSMQERLKYKCENVYDFISLGYWYLKQNIGKSATDLWLELSGVNAFVVKKSSFSKSISRGRSFNKNITTDSIFLLKQIILNFNHLFEELILKNYETKRISLFFRNKEKQTLVFNYNLPIYTNDRKVLLEVVKNMFILYFDNKILYRSTGVIFSSLKDRSFHQTNIFENTFLKASYKKEIYTIINEINVKYDNHKICFGMDLVGTKFSSKLGIRK
ncbi:MAG: hypothetical protein PHV23_01590 [Candidatus Gracilibacteria bacterium]|nr:hypothetical protein [Candidatus Gracilibacteria bacterium]